MNLNHIEIHRDEMKTIGIDVIPIGAFSEKAQAPHRDDHYMFIVLTQGLFELELDFKQIAMSNRCAYYVAPGQVHSYTNQDNCKGWYIFMDSLLISEKYTQILNTHLNSKQGIQLSEDSLIFSIIAFILFISSRCFTLPISDLFSLFIVSVFIFSKFYPFQLFLRTYLNSTHKMYSLLILIIFADKSIWFAGFSVEIVLILLHYLETKFCDYFYGFQTTHYKFKELSRKSVLKRLNFLLEYETRYLYFSCI